jgi:hypothetical protein
LTIALRVEAAYEISRLCRQLAELRIDGGEGDAIYRALDILNELKEPRPDLSRISALLATIADRPKLDSADRSTVGRMLVICADIANKLGVRAPAAALEAQQADASWESWNRYIGRNPATGAVPVGSEASA